MNTDHKKVVQASLIVALSGALYGFLGFFGIKLLEENMDISTMLFWRFMVAGLWVLPFTLKNNAIKTIVHADKRLLFFTFILGAMGYAGSSGFFFMASEHTGTGLAMVIFFSYPILIALTAWFTKKNSFNFITLSLLITMAFGLMLLHDPREGSVNILGIVFGIASAATYAFYIIGTKKYASGNLNSNIQTMLVSFGAAMFYFIISLKSGTFSIPSTLKTWSYLLTLGILITAIPIQLMIEGLKKISSMRASIISVLEPLVTVFVGIILLEESVSFIQIIGIIIILGSAIIVQFQREL